MSKKLKFMIFTMVFCLLFGVVFYLGYTRNDPAIEAGLTNSEAPYSQSNSAPPSGGCGCSSCNCLNK